MVSLDLNIFTVVLVTVSVLSLFQLSNTLVEKMLRRYVVLGTCMGGREFVWLGMV